MPIIDRSGPPYYDRFKKEKKYVRILALPGRVEQSAEWNELQSMVESRLVDLAETFYKDGQVLSGCLVTISGRQATIAPGKVYIDGNIVSFDESSVVEISGVGTEVLGLIRNQEIVDELDDPSLKDPAQGYDNYLQPGAHRLKETWRWGIVESEGYGIFTVINGKIPTPDPKPKPVSDDILDQIAWREYLKSGNYVLEGLKVTLVGHPDFPQDKKKLVVERGTACILGRYVQLPQNWVGDFELARETDQVIDEPIMYSPYNEELDSGGVFSLGETPVARVSRVTATVLTVETVTRGPVPGGRDSLRNPGVVEIKAVAMGGTWDPYTETFVAPLILYTPGVDYQFTAQRVDWSLGGQEPGAGETYQVAYTYRRQCVKEIVAVASVVNESLRHGDGIDDDLLDHSFVCETNEHTKLSMYVNDPVGSGPPSGTPGVDYQTKYRRDVDFVVRSNGKIDWYEYQISIVHVTRGTSDTDDITDIPPGYAFDSLIDVVFYSDILQESFDSSLRRFVNPTTRYTLGTDYTYVRGQSVVDWSLSGNQPSAGQVYSVACFVRRYRTSNHPSVGQTYYVSYPHWERKINGDYLARDSFYAKWFGPSHPSNVRQHYGLDNRDKIIFWRSNSYQTNPGNMNKPYPGTMVEVDYSYYLSRWAIVDFHIDDSIMIHYGGSSRQPSEPVFDYKEKSVSLAKVFCPADSLAVYVEEFGVRTIKVHDLHDIKRRVELAEENIAATALDLDAKSIPVRDKKGIMTTSFVNDDRLDRGWPGSAYSFDPVWNQLALPHTDSFYNLRVDSGSSTARVYERICTLDPSGTDSVEQPYYTGDESIAPYALAGQESFLRAQSAYMILRPSSDTLIIPRTMEFSSEADAQAWIASDVSKLTNPSIWFSKGWTGGTESRRVSIGKTKIWDRWRGKWVEINEDNYRTITTASSNQLETLVTTYIRDIQGNCRQIDVEWDIPGKMLSGSDLNLDYFLYFGGVRVNPTLTNGTPPGSVQGSFRPRLSDRGASGVFKIPPNIPEGRIEVRAVSAPILINGKIWNHVVTAIFDASVVEQLTVQFQRCRCNCWCHCVCYCWDCRSRCGTGPLAQTLEPVGRMRMLKSIFLDFTSVHPVYGVYGCIIRTENGQPTSNTIATGMIARAFLPADRLAGGGMREFVFEDPLFMRDEAYAIVATGEDGFNLNAVNEIAAGRDIRCKIATLGQVDKNLGITVGSQPFVRGMLWRSLTGVTWEQDQRSDLKFKAVFYTYTNQVEHIAYTNSIDVDSVTAFLCAWDSNVPVGTRVVFEYRTQYNTWTEFVPYKLTFCEKEATELQFRARLSTTNSDVSPFVSRYLSLYTQRNEPVLYAVTRNFTLDDPCDTCDIWIDSHIPDACSQQLRITFDNGASFITLSNPSPSGGPTGNLVEYDLVDENVDNRTYRHHWKVSVAPNVFTQVRVELKATATGPDARVKDPRFSRLIVICSIA